MRIEEVIFKGYKLLENKLIPFGFTLESNKYIKTYKIYNNDFTVEVTIDNGIINGRIIDNTFDEEYTLFRVENIIGDFVGKIKSEYESILIDIRNNCYTKMIFPDEQATRIAKYIMNKYQDDVEFLFKKFPYYGIFRNKRNNKWYALIGNVNDNKLADNTKARFVINLKANQDRFDELIKIDNIYPAYHMHKKSWISVSLSDYLDDSLIESLIDMSYEEIDKSK